MLKLTEQQAIVITGYTGVVTCKFSTFHKDVEKRLGRPVYTHEFLGLSEEISLAYKDDFIAMCGEGN